MTTELTDLDRDALTLAIDVTRNESHARHRQVDKFLETRLWIEVATFCANCAQSRALNLPPWQPSPCHVGNMEAAFNGMLDEARCGYRAAALLRQRMSRCGVSRWHPDPARECDRVEAERANG
ncbi:hypothetical protein G6321_00048610 [Bradyrhizobium barranii subsp. barranii]|uniref:Uncharacterized protein n=1 Tax=Bradyrhizobium barranii subsp. barranii TaxID=2823807 RepID=A0A7Z0TR09_9BRAD|nr:hypothetical protein [Bradyrhizobium barranii]UGX93383.1 hypothetical protein G6321_00048610 [Bradyrhizobium barranii subsp. barranii]